MSSISGTRKSALIICKWWVRTPVPGAIKGFFLTKYLFKCLVESPCGELCTLQCVSSTIYCPMRKRLTLLEFEYWNYLATKSFQATGQFPFNPDQVISNCTAKISYNDKKIYLHQYQIYQSLTKIKESWSTKISMIPI